MLSYCTCSYEYSLHIHTLKQTYSYMAPVSVFMITVMKIVFICFNGGNNLYLYVTSFILEYVDTYHHQPSIQATQTPLLISNVSQTLYFFIRFSLTHTYIHTIFIVLNYRVNKTVKLSSFYSIFPFSFTFFIIIIYLFLVVVFTFSSSCEFYIFFCSSSKILLCIVRKYVLIIVFY